jgi:hypothetical protein
MKKLINLDAYKNTWKTMPRESVTTGVQQMLLSHKKNPNIGNLLN